MREARVMIVLLGVLAGMVASTPALRAQEDRNAASVRFADPLVRVSAEVSAFILSLEAANLQHDGRIGYDDDGDGRSDRFVPSIGLGSFEFTVLFDPSRVRVVEVKPNEGLSSTGRTFRCFSRSDEPGSYTFGCASYGDEPGPQGSLPLADVQLQPLSAGPSFVTVEDVTLSGPLADDIVVAGEDRVVAAVHVVGEPATGNGDAEAGGDRTGRSGPVEEDPEGIPAREAGSEGRPGLEDGGHNTRVGREEAAAEGMDRQSERSEGAAAADGDSAFNKVPAPLRSVLIALSIAVLGGGGVVGALAWRGRGRG